MITLQAILVSILVSKKSIGKMVGKRHLMLTFYGFMVKKTAPFITYERFILEEGRKRTLYPLICVS